MSQEVKVFDVSALERLDTALTRFAEEARETLRGVRLEVQRVLENLEQEIRRWQTELRRREDLHKQAMALLQACLASGYTDQDGRYHAPNCSQPEEVVRQTRRACEEALQKANTLTQSLKAIQQQNTAYEQQARRLEEYFASQLPRAKQYLHRSRDHLSGYASGGMGGGSGLSGPARLIDALVGAPFGLMEALAGIMTPKTSEDMPSLQSEPQTLPATQFDFSRLPPPSSGQWKMVNLAQIDTSDMEHVQGPQDFKKTSYAEMEKGIKTLISDILPAIQQGHTRDYFEQLDQTLNLPYPKGFLRVYEAFFGSEPIHLEKVGDTCTVVNGYHRIWLAQKLGLPFLPASVVEVG